MENIYVLLLGDSTFGIDWEDMIFYVLVDEAIKASIAFPNDRVEIFEKNYNKYVPSYSYYKNGILHTMSVLSLDKFEEKIKSNSVTVPPTKTVSIFSILYNCFSNT